MEDTTVMEDAAERLNESILNFIEAVGKVSSITISREYYKKHKKELKPNMHIIAKTKGNVINGVKQPKKTYAYYFLPDGTAIHTTIMNFEYDYELSEC